jgi:hypothetical protein
VLSFSMAVGPVTIWALGKTGWFEIRPARIYRPTFDKMAEGVKLYYFLTDIYESNKDQRKSLEVSKLFDQVFSIKRYFLYLILTCLVVCSEI